MDRDKGQQALLPHEAAYGRFEPAGPGLVRTEAFERCRQDEDHPVELIGGWVLPMPPGDFETGSSWIDLAAVLQPVVKTKRWRISLDARHRLPSPPNTVVFPDFAIHAVSKVDYIARTHSIGRVPDIVIEFLSEATRDRDSAPRGAKFLAYQMSGVREYYYAWPDGRGAAGFVMRRGVFVPLKRDAMGFFSSPLLGCRLRLAEAATRAR